MRTRIAAVALLLAFAPVAVAAPARAQTASEDATTDIARARFKEGVGFYDKGQYEQARAAFLQAYALKKHPAVLLNLAWSSLKSGHTLEAEHYFKQFLTEGKDLTEKQKADASDGLNQAHAKLGRIEIAAAAGTEVTIDGDRVGIAPLAEPVVVEPGAHTVKFRGPDGATDTDSVSVVAGEKAVAHFAKTATPPATPAPPPAAPVESEPTPAPPVANAEPVPQPEVSSGGGGAQDSHSGLVVGGVVVLGLGIGSLISAAVVGIASKNSAQNKANQIAANIVAHGGHTCHPIDAPPSITNIQQLCAQFDQDNDDVNKDASWGNGIAIAGGVLVAGGGTMLIMGLVKRSDSSSHALALPQITPIVGRDVGGLSLSGSF
jgi:hypothetical protein